MCTFFISSSNIYLVLFVNISVNAVLPFLLEEVESCVATKPVSAFAEKRFEATQCLHRLDTSSKMDSNFLLYCNLEFCLYISFWVNLKNAQQFWESFSFHFQVNREDSAV